MSDAKLIAFHRTKMRDPNSNCIPQNESSDGDSSSSTYGQIKTFESFFEVKMTMIFKFD